MRSVVGTVATATGRGPNHARSWCQDGTIVVTLQDVHLPGERLLLDEGHSELVATLREAYLSVLERPLTDAAERAIGRRVVSVLCDHSTRLDLTTVVFVLDPESARVEEPAPAGVRPTLHAVQ